MFENVCTFAGFLLFWVCSWEQPLGFGLRRDREQQLLKQQLFEKCGFSEPETPAALSPVNPFGLVAKGVTKQM